MKNIITSDMHRKIKYVEKVVEEQGFQLLILNQHFALRNMHKDYTEDNQIIISDDLNDVLLYINGWIARKTHDQLVNKQ